MPRIATVTTLRAPVEDTLSFIRYHLNSGIDHMFLFFDDPNDEAIFYISDNEQLSCYRCTQNHWKKNDLNLNSKVQLKQRTNATLALRYAQKKDMDWLVHLDSDELLFSKNSFTQLFTGIRNEIDVIRFPVLEAVPQQLKYERPFQDIHLFKAHLGLKSSYDDFSILQADQKQQLRRAKCWYRRKKIYHMLLNNKKNQHLNFLLGHTVGKAATRTTANVKYVENHLPVIKRNTNPGIKISQTGYILHYDCQGYHKWKEKWSSRIDGSTNFETKRFSKSRLKLQELFKEAAGKNEQELKTLYKDLYYLTKYEKGLLYLTGLIKIINFKELLFAPVSNSKRHLHNS